MPKGVEHIATAFDEVRKTIVIRAVMPKGVEHNVCSGLIRKSEDGDPSRDA